MIGQRIRERRRQLNMTQEELAHKMGYKSKSTINKIEKDVHDVNQATLAKFAEVLDVDPNYFLEGMSHRYYPDATVMDWFKRLMALPPDAIDNVLQYIEFLEQRSEQS